MRVTRRGKVVIGAMVAAFVIGTRFGTEPMGVVVIAGLVSVGGSLALVWWADNPTISRTRPPPGFPGEPRDITLSVAVPRSLRVVVEDTLPAGFGPATRHQTAISGPVTYQLTPASRGIVSIGPATLTITDPLGLVERVIETRQRTKLVTYPPIIELPGLDEYANLGGKTAPVRERREFDRLREYQRGDRARDIDWKSSAKRAGDPLVVKEFVANADVGEAVIVAESPRGSADSMASAAASLSLRLLDAGIAIGLTTADEQLPVAGGSRQRERVLHALARTQGGQLSPEKRTDAALHVVEAATGELRIRIGQRQLEMRPPTGESPPQLGLAPDGGKRR